LYRPQFHFTPRVNWTNDPNGLVYYNGEYHLFFQHNPVGINWGNMTWGHAISTDLLHWQQLPNALEPDSLGTMFSGSAVVDRNDTSGFQDGQEKTLVAIYTAAGSTSEESQEQPFTQCIAFSNDCGRTWIKYGGNPVINHIVKENRDPKVVRHAPSSKWVMALYKDGNTYALFNSPDLKTWTHMHDLEMPECSECPDFFEIPVDGEAGVTRWVFTAANGRYLVGKFDGTRYVPESGPLQVDYGANYYAVQTYSDTPDGRRIQIAWMAGGKYPDMPFNQQMSLPCELTLRNTEEGLRLFRNPIKELESLREHEQIWHDLALRDNANLLDKVNGDLFDIVLHLELNHGDFNLVVRGEVIAYSTSTNQLTCLGKQVGITPVNGELKLRVLVDRSSIEIFVNDGQATMTSCFLPAPVNHSLGVTGTDGVRVKHMSIYGLKSTWW
jgi:fructan beta-fructosidase